METPLRIKLLRTLQNYERIYTGIQAELCTRPPERVAAQLEDIATRIRADGGLFPSSYLMEDQDPL